MVAVGASMIPMLSAPVVAATWSVAKPVRLAGSFTEMVWFCHEVTVRVCAVLDPAGGAVTLQPLHCEPRFAPVRVMVEPAANARPGAAPDRGVALKTAAPSLQRVAAKEATVAATVPQVMDWRDVL